MNTTPPTPACPANASLVCVEVTLGSYPAASTMLFTQNTLDVVLEDGTVYVFADHNRRPPYGLALEILGEEVDEL